MICGEQTKDMNTQKEDRAGNDEEEDVVTMIMRIRMIMIAMMMKKTIQMRVAILMVVGDTTIMVIMKMYNSNNFWNIKWVLQ
jgi:hypothetical protein